MARRLLTGALLAMVMLTVFAVESLSSGAATVPAVSVPSASIPSVSNPAVQTPTVNLPPVSVPPVHTPPISVPPVSVPPVHVPTVSVPSVHTPSVNVPSVSTPSVGSTTSPAGAGGQAGSSDSAPTSSSGSANGASNGAGQSGAATPSAASSLSGHSASARGARVSGSARQARSTAARQRHLRNLVVRLTRCLSTLQPQAQRVLLLRAGIGSAQAYSGAAVASTLHISGAREARIERAALVELQVAARDGRCRHASALIQVPAQDRLAPTAPALVNPNGSAGSSNASGHTTVGQNSQQRTRGSGRGNPVIQNAAVAGLPTSNSPAGPWVLGALLMLAVLALLSDAGRRIAARRQPSTSAGAVALPGMVPASKTKSKAKSKAKAKSKPTKAVAAEKAGAAEAAVATEAVGTEAAAAEAVGAEAVGASQARAGHAPASQSATAAPPRLAPGQGANGHAAPAQAAPVQGANGHAGPVQATPGQGANGQAAPRQAPTSQAGPRPTSSPEAWMRTHRSQIALGLTAAAGGALRLVARQRGRRRH